MFYDCFKKSHLRKAIEQRQRGALHSPPRQRTKEIKTLLGSCRQAPEPSRISSSKRAAVQQGILTRQHPRKIFRSQGHHTIVKVRLSKTVGEA